MQIGDPSNVEHRAQESLASQIVDEPNVDSIPEKEIVRRQRIAQSNKGKVPWNKGRRHPPGICVSFSYVIMRWIPSIFLGFGDDSCGMLL
jgi:hypothetical protein